MPIPLPAELDRLERSARREDREVAREQAGAACREAHGVRPRAVVAGVCVGLPVGRIDDELVAVGVDEALAGAWPLKLDRAALLRRGLTRVRLGGGGAGDAE